MAAHEALESGLQHLSTRRGAPMAEALGGVQLLLIRSYSPGG